MGSNDTAKAGDPTASSYARTLSDSRAGTIFHGISADGSVVVGSSGLNSNQRSFRWTVATGTFQYLRSRSADTVAYDVSADGSIVVGRYDIGSNMRAVRWTAGNSEMDNLGTLPNTTSSFASAVSADGSAIVGGSGDYETVQAFRWTATNGMQSLGPSPPGGTDSVAYGVNADGSVIVGEYYAPGPRAFRWTKANGVMQDIGMLPGSTESTAWAVSDNGSVVVGDSRFTTGPDAHEWRAFRWSAATGAMEPLGALVGGTASVAYGLSADGSVIVGQATSGNGQRGFRWTEASGMVSVEDWLRGNGVTVASDFTGNASGVSADGNIIVGQTSSNTPYIARVVPANPATSETRTNLDDVDTPTSTAPDGGTRRPRTTEPDSSTSSVPSTSSTPSTPSTYSADPASSRRPTPTTYAASSGQPVSSVTSTRSIVPERSGIIDLDQYARTLAARPNAGVGLNIANIVLDGAHGMPMRSLLEPGHQSFSIVSDIGHNDGHDAAGAFGIADIGYGIGLEGGATARIAVGGLYDQRDINTGGDFIHSGFYISPEISLPLTDGLYATIGGYYAPGRMSIERGYLNGGAIDYSRGEADLDAWAVKLRFDWLDALTICEWNLTPYAGVTYTKAKMGAYAETGGAFPARFDASGEQSTIIRAGLDGITDLSSSVRLLARAEAAYRLEKKTAATTGAIDGLMGFSFAGGDIDRFWLRGGLGAEFDMAGGTASLNLNVTTEGDDPDLWVRTGWKITF
ncbi:autotransporter domain-containing protein [Agrobacterium rhizogenes]|uniref:autotransporter domain-containing protein n=1 Tax=Rhizobium rhizogenes TaxID=359 RepID=UPI0022B6B493|nr:autotransporter domain-containing protein [Rhizobium rhizogenes]MCZ7445981.1 autotransporter domain-containing protein [Rhizobium rhizogenes]